MKKRVSQRSAESREFSPGARFPSTGKVDRVVRINKRQIVYKTNNIAENRPVVIC